MNTAHWHLLLNHFPIVGTVLGTLIGIAGLVFKKNAIKQTALGVLIFSGLTAIPAYLTGEGAEEAVENLPGISETYIENHEELAEVFLVAVLLLSALSLVTLWLSSVKAKFPSVMFSLVLIGSIAVCIVAKQVGTSGGEIRHAEIRYGNTKKGN